MIGKVGRTEGIWTPDLLHPKQTRYQAALRSDISANGLVNRGLNQIENLIW